MNHFKIYLDHIKIKLSKNIKKIPLESINDLDDVILENPPEKFDYDFSTNAAMVLSKKSKTDPRALAEKIKMLLDKEIKDFSKIDIAGPGFINIQLSNKAWLKIIDDIEKLKKNKKYNIEFVSANPTGPMHVGHCRGAVFGDVLANLLKFSGNKVTKEFYINDYGKQIENFTKSVFLRMRELLYKEKFPTEKDLYPGNYIIDIAKNILKNNKKLNLKDFNNSYKILKNQSLKYSMNLIKSDLIKLGISHDYFFSETHLVDKNLVKKTIDKLKKDKFAEDGFLEPPKGEEIINWKKNKRLIFKSTLFGDDADRALKKDDGSWTYFANDVAYHSTKVKRNFDYLINVLGADHTGYIKRISAAVNALSNNKTSLICKVCQLVKLFKNGEPYKMSKRSGEFISVSDLLKEVDKDSIRFMMLSRSNDVELDFDFTKVLEKNKENPVYYVQYSYARINSLFNLLKIKNNKKIKINEKNFNPNHYDIKLLRKIIEWPRVVEVSSVKHEPHRITFYLYELSTIFHSYWSKGNEDQNFKFIKNGKIKSHLTLKIFQLIVQILQNSMSILGVSLPKKM